MASANQLTIAVCELEWSRARAPAQQRPIFVSASCALASFIVQAIASIAIVHMHPPQRLHANELMAGVARPADGDSIERLRVVFLDEEEEADVPWPEPPSLAALALAGRLDLSLIPIEVPRADFGEYEVESSTARLTRPVALQGDDRRMLFERYLRQIEARVDRAWERAGSVSGRCLAYITQDAKGIVEDVDLAGCDADSAFRDAVSTAIRRASPLPAPPVAQVFSERVAIEVASSSP